MADWRYRFPVLALCVVPTVSLFYTVSMLLWPGPSAPAQAHHDQVEMAARAVAGGHVAATAFAVAPGMVVTNAHVTLRCRLADLPLTVDDAPGWHVVREDPQSELALLSGPAAALPSLPLSAAPQLPHGTPVMLLGYPLGQDGGPGQLQAARGKVQRSALTVHRPELGTSVSFFTTAPNGQDVDPRWSDGLAYFGLKNADRLRWILEIAAPTNHGDSGGPVVDSAGNVVGVIFAGNPDVAETSAVTLDDLRDFLLTAGVTPQFAPPPESGRPDWQRALETARPSVMRVGC